MNEYLNVFQGITQSSEQLLTDEHNSPEIQQSATSLKYSVQPCIEELKQSAIKLKRLVQVGFDDLAHAEDVWNCKPKIAEASKQEIWEQLGEISGRAFKISMLGSKYKSEAVETFQDSWDRRTTFLHTKWFTEASGKPKHSISLGDRSGFIKDLVAILNQVDEDYKSLIKKKSYSISQEILSISLDVVKHFLNLLDQQSQNSLNSQLNKLLIEINANFSSSHKYFYVDIELFSKSVNSAIETFLKQNYWSISPEQFTKFSKEQVSSKMEKYITAIFDDRVELATKALEQAIAFYNYFLEKQNRYQQETLQQRQAEKAWIDQQRQQLMQVKNGLEAILSNS